MKLLGVVLLLAALLCAIGCAYVVPLRLLGGRSGARQGIIIGIPVALITAVMCGSLGGAVGESLAGLGGVPFGLFCGTLIGGATANGTLGVAGMAVARIVALVKRSWSL